MAHKLKTHKGLKKRFRVTAQGKIVHKRRNASHLMSAKSGNRCRNMRKPAIITTINRHMMLELLGER